MKVTKAQAAQNRQDILEAAARLYREHGLDGVGVAERSEEHTSELQSRLHLVCRLLLEKKKIDLTVNHLLVIGHLTILIFYLDPPSLVLNMTRAMYLLAHLTLLTSLSVIHNATCSTRR